MGWGGAWALDCLSICKSLNGRVRGHRLLDELSVFRELAVVAWWLGLSNGCQESAQLPASLVQPAPQENERGGEKKKTGSAASRLSVSLLFI